MNVRRTLGFWPLRGSAGWLLAASLLLCGWLSPNLAFAQADLTVDITSVTDTTPQQGQSVTVRYRIRNGSRTTTANNFTVRFYLSSDATITTADRYLGAQRTFTRILPLQTLPSAFTTYTINITIPVDAATGSQRIGAIIDYNNGVTESNENNNTDNITVNISANNTLVDLQVSFVKIDKTSAKPGDQVTLEYRIYNAGGANVNTSFLTRQYLSTNATITTGDTYLNTQQTTTSINGRQTLPSATTTFKVTVTIPTNTNPGSYFLGALTDYNNRVAETDNGNNFASAAISVVAATPDVRVDIISVNDTTPQEGQTIQVRYRVSNVGGATASNVKLRFYLSGNTTITVSDNYLNVERTHTIAAGQTLPSTTTFYTVNVTIPASYPTGTEYLGAIIDYDNQINEGSAPAEANNTDLLALNIQNNNNTRDLQVTLLNASVSRVAAGQTVTLQYRVFNAGSAAINNAFQLRAYLSTNATITTTDTSLGGDRTINSLGARSGQTVNVTVTIPANTSPGDYYIGIFADRTNTVAETDETNNFRALPLTITDNRPDLRVEVVSVNPTLANQGQTVQVRYRISNNGGGNATNFTLRFYLSNNASVTTADTYLFIERTFPSIAAGATLPSTTGVYTINVTIPAAAQSGNRYIGAIIDYDAKVNESNENNNTDSVAVTVRPAPFVDLVIGDLKVDKTTVAPGGQLTFEFQVSNVGNTDVNTLFSTQIYRSTNNIVNVSDTPLGGNTNISAIKGGEILPSTTTYYKVTITIPANTPLGGYFIGPVTDYTARVTESNNNNNGKGLQITVARTPTLDLAANATTITPTRQFVGQSITVNYSVTNKGNTAIASYTIGIYYSTDATISATDRRLIAFTRANIAASATQTGTRTITLPTTLALGPGFIGVFVDQGAAITEVDETNNTSSTGITVVDDKDKDGVPSDVDCDDNDDKVFPAYNGKAAAPEVCDGKDNNCNKTTDENIQPRPCYTGSTGCTQGSSGAYTCVGACKAGTQSCTGGKFGACTGEVLPKAETCNGADDNCDGSVDNGITCSEPAPEPPPADGGPRPDAPPLADRRPDIRPTDAGPTDRPVSDRPPTDAKPADVRPGDAGPTDKPPVPDTGDCYSKGCPTGEICRNGMCEADPCASVTCQADEVCKGGTCFKVCGCTQCPAGERCLDGACVTDRCATVRCAAGETCNPDDGMCQEDKCPAITCGPGRVCQLSACVDDPCLNLNCPSGTKCENGQCIGEQCGGENPGEGVSGENTTGENPASSENANTEPVVGDQASTDAAPGDLSASEPGGNEQISIGEPATPDSSSTDVVSGNDNNPGTDGAPPVGGGCCETGRASSQAPLMIFLFSLFFIGWVRRK